MERLTMTSDKGGVAFTFDLDITCEKSEIMKILKVAEKLKVYEDLEEQGKLLRLPVAVGDTVYRIHKGTKPSPDRVYECKVVGVRQEYNTLSVKLHANINEESYSIWVDNWFDKCQIGHEFFLTKEAAEAALKEMSE